MKDLNLAKVIMDLVSKYISPVAGTSWKYVKRLSEPKLSSLSKKPTFQSSCKWLQISERRDL
jgi:hypothetical protein